MSSALADLLNRLQALLAGATSREDVDALEGAFAAVVDDDETFSDLQNALAMYRGPGYADDLDTLRQECRWALDRLTSSIIE